MRGSVDLEHGGGVKNRGGARNYYAETEVERPWTSWLIPVFMVTNIGMFVALMFVNNCPNNIHHNSTTGVIEDKCVARFVGRFSFQPLRENPLFGPSSSAMRKLGALEWKSVLHKQGWRLFSCIWLHAGLIHLILNMCSLALIGMRLERHFGFARVGIIYLLSGIGGSMMSSLFVQKSVSVGASAALFGLLGAMLSELITNWGLYNNKSASLLTLLVTKFFNLAIGMLPYVENFANLGGFFTGFLLGFVMLLRPQYGWPEYKTYQIVMLVLSSILVIAGFIVGLVQLYFRSMGEWM